MENQGGERVFCRVEARAFSQFICHGREAELKKKKKKNVEHGKGTIEKERFFRFLLPIH